MGIRLLSLWLLIESVLGAQWAVLVAGSNGYWNYRHQADICHSYQVLISHGLPSSNIIVFAFNDIANNTDNPFPGKIFNAAGSDPLDVYADCKIDYQGNDTNTSNFLAVLTGNETIVSGVGTGRVLKSGSEDYVFINFVDHGAPGVISFPNDLLYADTLVETLISMKMMGMFKQMVFFLETCDGGSMFDGLLPNNTSIYAMTAANDIQSSWGIYCPSDDYVSGVDMYTCLGDLFTVNWMDTIDQSDLSQLTLDELYRTVATLTNLSNVMQYGDMSFSGEVLGTFFGLGKPAERQKGAEIETDWGNVWQPSDAKYQYLSYRYLKEPTIANADLLIEEITSRSKITTIFTDLMTCLSPLNPGHLQDANYSITDFTCLKTAVSAYIVNCGSISEFGFSFLSVLKNACEEGISAAEINGALESICEEEDRVGLDYYEKKVGEDRSCKDVRTGATRLRFRDY